MQPGKCYKRNYNDSTYLFKVKSIEEINYFDTVGLDIYEEKSIGITNLGLVRRTHHFISHSEIVEEIDESVLDKLIKMYDICRTSMLDTINQDKANETQGNTTQGDYQLP